jgi:hypothetical protein
VGEREIMRVCVGEREIMRVCVGEREIMRECVCERERCASRVSPRSWVKNPHILSLVPLAH